ncbi:MAG: alpha/beta hydrolase [Erysipelotrichaceae bacterium]|nr:alpha/beta hydrolase [Erysipelotrichaceae bacterium]
MKKSGKILMILLVAAVLLLAAGAGIFLYIKAQFPSGKDTEITEGYYKKFTSDAELEMKYSQTGDYEVSYTEMPSENESIGRIRFWYPAELEKNNKVYPLIMVVNASGTPASSYEPFFERLASWGFIVIGNEDPQTGTGETASITLDSVLNLSADHILYDRIDLENMGIIGYSQGGAGALAAVTEYENGKLYKTIFTGSAAYQFMAGNFGWYYDATKIHIPYFMTTGTGKSDDKGVADPTKEYGGVSPLSALIENYEQVPEDVLKIRARAAGAEHEEILMRTDGYMTAWMLYQLQGSEEAGKAFLGEDAEILHNANWQDIDKNR